MTAKIMRDNFLLVASAYCVHKGLSESRVSTLIHGNQAFIASYRAGKMSPTVKNYFRMLDKMRAGWPEDVPWPETLPIAKLGKNIDDPESLKAAGKGMR